MYTYRLRGQRVGGCEFIIASEPRGALARFVRAQQLAPDPRRSRYYSWPATGKARRHVTVESISRVPKPQKSIRLFAISYPYELHDVCRVADAVVAGETRSEALRDLSRALGSKRLRPAPAKGMAWYGGVWNQIQWTREIQMRPFAVSTARGQARTAKKGGPPNNEMHLTAPHQRPERRR